MSKLASAVSGNEQQLTNRFRENYKVFKKAVWIGSGLSLAYVGGAAYVALALGLAATINIVAVAIFVAAALICIGFNAYVLSRNLPAEKEGVESPKKIRKLKRRNRIAVKEKIKVSKKDEEAAVKKSKRVNKVYKRKLKEGRIGGFYK